jgi:hypothetical protein
MRRLFGKRFESGSKTHSEENEMENGSNPDPYLIVKKNNLDNGSNPDPNTRCEGIIWKTVQIRIQTQSEK